MGSNSNNSSENNSSVTVKSSEYSSEHEPVEDFQKDSVSSENMMTISLHGPEIKTFIFSGEDEIIFSANYRELREKIDNYKSNERNF